MQMMFCGRTNSMEEVAETLVHYLENTVINVENKGRGIDIVLQDNTMVKIFYREGSNTPEEMRKEIAGMYNYYAAVKTEKEELKSSLLNQISVWNSVYIIEFETNDVDERNNFIYSSIINTVSKHKAYYITGSLAIMNGENKLVFNTNGESELTEIIPEVNADTLYPDRKEITELDEARWKKTAQKIEALKLPTMEKMKLQLRENEVKIRDKEELVKRAVSLVTVALYSEALYSDKKHSVSNAYEYIDTLDEKFNVTQYMSVNELNYINDKTYSERNCFKFTWDYESAALLFWSLGLMENLNEVNKICNVTDVVRVIRESDSLEELVQKAELKPVEELLEMQDLVMRYRWAHIELATKRQAIPDSYDIGVLEKRSKTLNWLLTDLYGDDWDEVDTPA